MSPMTAGWAGTSGSPMRRESANPRYRFGTPATLIILIATVLAIISPAFATAADSTPFTPENGQGHLIVKDDTSSRFPYFMDSFNGLSIDAEPDELGEPRGLDIVSRALGSGTSIGNNQFEKGEISLGGQLQKYSFSLSSASSNASDTQSNNVKRANSTVYLSLNICTGPLIDEGVSSTDQRMPQLSVYVSTSDSQNLRPGKNGGGEVYNSSAGYMSATVNTESDVYIGIAAQDGGDFTGSFSYQIAASTDGYFHNVDDQYTLSYFGGDSGSETAFLTTVKPADERLTDEQRRKWENNTPVYTLFVNNADSTTATGLSRSYCALEQLSQGEKTSTVQASMSRRERLDNGLQQQFYVTGLNSSSTYVSVVGMGNSTSSNGMVGGGGRVWKAQNFTTKSDENCDVIYDLGFCSDIARAVPSNPSFNMTELRTKYDEHAAELYKNFDYSLQQIQCNTSNETIWSMAVNCTDCARAYKSWLCEVTIPKCDDYSSTSNTSAVVVRNAAQAFPNGTNITNTTELNSPIFNKPRNLGLIDTDIKPGPYKEVLPDLKICHSLTQNCPMSLGFSCPEGKYLQYSYSSAAWRLRALYPLGPVTITSSIVAVLLWAF